MTVIESTTVRITPDGRMNRRDAASYLGLSYRTLGNWSSRGIGPASVRVGGRRFYRVADLDAFIGAQG
ncbi:AlpA family transcriptional regulator [Sphingomonas sp. NBWT7]|uniref:helix-turn-helix transcriptional regulator n=1 Tax=Sphingomonas sp. NBWT7 TaxID=2596913 RepID=UPI001627EA08|nr:helix-turn-helix domain-containing protein [Sphingomonas sp. NBWT7]